MVRRSPKRLVAQAPQQRGCRQCGRSGCCLLRSRTARQRFAHQSRQCPHVLHRVTLGRRSARHLCLAGWESKKGTTLPLFNREFSVLANRPVSFTLYSSRTRHDAHGEVAALDEANVHRHPPLVALLRYGKKMRDVYLIVGLRASFTEVGTLELWCESRDTPHRWRLQFELRGEEAQAQQLDSAKLQPVPTPSSDVSTFETAVESAAHLIGCVFGGSADGDTLAPETLVRQMEAVLGAKRDSWPISAIRRFGDVLIELAAGRKKSPRHEGRWLNLAGFCLRPGFGVPG